MPIQDTVQAIQRKGKVKVSKTKNLLPAAGTLLGVGLVQAGSLYLAPLIAAFNPALPGAIIALSGTLALIAVNIGIHIWNKNDKADPEIEIGADAPKLNSKEFIISTLLLTAGSILFNLSSPIAVRSSTALGVALVVGPLCVGVRKDGWLVLGFKVLIVLCAAGAVHLSASSDLAALGAALICGAHLGVVTKAIQILGTRRANQAMTVANLVTAPVLWGAVFWSSGGTIQIPLWIWGIGIIAGLTILTANVLLQNWAGPRLGELHGVWQSTAPALGWLLTVPHDWSEVPGLVSIVLTCVLLTYVRKLKIK